MNLRIIPLLLVLSACGENLTPEQLVQRGNDALEKGNEQSAIIFYKNALQQDSNNSDARIQLAKSYLALYQPTVALHELERAQTLGARAEAILLYRAQAYFMMRDANSLLASIVVTDHSSAIQDAIHAYRVLAYLQKGELSSAEQELQQIQATTDSDLTLHAKARLALGHRDYALVEELVKRFSAAADADRQVIRAELAQFQQAPQQAVALYQKVLQLRPNDLISRFEQIFLQIGLGDIDAAEANVAVVMKQISTHPRVDFANGLIAFRKADYSKSASLLDGLVANYPQFTEAYLYLGIAHFNLGNYASAITHLQYLLSQVPNHLQAGMVYAGALLQQNQPDKAESVIRGLVEAYPDNSKLLSTLGNIRLAQGDTEEGIELLNQAISKNPDEPNTYLALGRAQLSNSDMAAAEKTLEKASVLDPTSNQAQLSLYFSYVKQKRFNRAVAIADDLIAKDGKESLGYNLKAQAIWLNGDIAAATKLFKDTLQRFPGDIAAAHQLAKIAIDGKEYASAKSYYQTVLNHDAKHTNTLIAMGQLAALMRGSEAEEWYQQAVTSKPAAVQPRLILAQHYLSKNDGTKAYRVLNELDDKGQAQREVRRVQVLAKMQSNELLHAKRILNSLLVDVPNNPDLLFMRAQIEEKGGEKQKMTTTLEEIVRKSPHHLPTNSALAKMALESGDERTIDTVLARVPTINDQNNLVVLLANIDWHQDRSKRAIDRLVKWDKKNPRQPAVMMTLANFHQTMGDDQQAGDLYKLLMKLSANNPVILNNYAMLLAKSDPKLGLKYAKQAAELAPSNPVIIDTYGYLLMQDGQLEAALEQLTTAFGQAPDNWEIEYNLASALIKLNKRVDVDSHRQHLIATSRNAKDRDRAEALK